MARELRALLRELCRDAPDRLRAVHRARHADRARPRRRHPRRRDLLPGAQPDHHPGPPGGAPVRLVHPPVGAALHPGRQHRRAGRRGAGDHRPRDRPRRPVPRRPRLRQHRRQPVLRRDLRLGGGRRLGPRHLPDPQMVRKGYDKDFATVLTICTAILAPIIPPSIVAVIYAWMADESVAAIFAGGYVPGLLVALGMAVPTFIIARQRNYPRSRRRPSELPGRPGEGAAGPHDPRDHHGRHRGGPLHADRGRRRGRGLRAGRAAALLQGAPAARRRGSSRTRRGSAA